MWVARPLISQDHEPHVESFDGCVFFERGSKVAQNEADNLLGPFPRFETGSIWVLAWVLICLPLGLV